ncbi:unnamed protein product [[Candida] boidinii]|nr:unnamed protein product [[Candida] boidinii]
MIPKTPTKNKVMTSSPEFRKITQLGKNKIISAADESFTSKLLNLSPLPNEDQESFDPEIQEILDGINTPGKKENMGLKTLGSPLRLGPPSTTKLNSDPNKMRNKHLIELDPNFNCKEKIYG